MIVTVLAHGGGWDEALVLLAPVALFVALRVLERRRRRRGREPATGRADAGVVDDPDTSGGPAARGEEDREGR